MRYSVPEGSTRPRHGPAIVPRWADDPVSLRPVTPTSYSFRLRRGFRTFVIRGSGRQEREEAWIVGLFHLTHPDGPTTFVVEYAGRAWATARADERPWPTKLNTLFDSSPTPWLPVRAQSLEAVPTDPARPLEPPTAAPFPAQIASENIIREGGKLAPYSPHPPEAYT